MTEAVKPDHVHLFIPGPTEVRREILQAQSHWMIGHNGADFETLFARARQVAPTLLYPIARVRLYLFRHRPLGKPPLW